MDKTKYIIDNVEYTKEIFEKLSYEELLSIKQICFDSIQNINEKIKMYQNTNTEEKNSKEYWRKMNNYTFARKKNVEAMNILSVLIHLRKENMKQENIQKSQDKNREEKKYLYNFWKIAKGTLSSRQYEKINSQVEVISPKPESLV